MIYLFKILRLFINKKRSVFYLWYIKNICFQTKQMVKWLDCVSVKLLEF